MSLYLLASNWSETRFSIPDYSQKNLSTIVCMGYLTALWKFSLILIPALVLRYWNINFIRTPFVGID